MFPEFFRMIISVYSYINVLNNRICCGSGKEKHAEVIRVSVPLKLDSFIPDRRLLPAIRKG